LSLSRVFKVFQSEPRSLAEYERVVLEEIARDTENTPEAALTHEMILAEARKEAARKVEEAFAEGVRRGTEKGRVQYLEAVAESAAALNAAADAIREAHERFLDGMEPHVVELAGAIARRVLQREAETDPGLILRTARKALEHLIERERVVIHVNPKDFDGLRAEKVKLLEEFDGMRQITVQPDEAIAPGGCVVETDLVHVDARIEAQFEAILDGLRQAPE
jgi:flagellar assembly protein FliH